MFCRPEVWQFLPERQHLSRIETITLGAISYHLDSFSTQSCLPYIYKAKSTKPSNTESIFLHSVKPQCWSAGQKALLSFSTWVSFKIQHWVFTQAVTPVYFARRVLATCRWQYGQLRFRFNLQYNIVARQDENTCCLTAELYKRGNRTVRAEKGTPLGAAGI